MPSQHSSVLVFGATGEVGSSAAQEASSRGAKVWLCMRDITKHNPYISLQTEESKHMSRIQADLTDSGSVSTAVQSANASAAFIYSVRAQDHMRGALSALQKAGIKHIVFLSTNAVRRAWSAQENLRSIKPDFFVPWKHAQVELGLEELGVAHVVVRPGFFASNPFRMYLSKSEAGKPVRARVIAQDIQQDPIDPQDIGRVAGALLVEPKLAKSSAVNGEVRSIVTLTGPQLMTQREQWVNINQALAAMGKSNVEVVEIGPEEYADNLVAQHGTPRPVALSLARSMADKFDFADQPDLMETQGNIKRITGRQPTGFGEYVKREIARYL